MSRTLRLVGRIVRGLVAITISIGLVLALFMILPLMQAIGDLRRSDDSATAVTTINFPTPEEVIEEPQKEEEKPPEEKPPEMTPEPEDLTIEEISQVLNPTMGDANGWFKKELRPLVDSAVSRAGNMEEIVSIADLDQKPRAVYQPSPAMSAQLRKKAPGTVYIIFLVDERGRVENPIIQSSSDPIFEKPALSAVKQWKFEPGKRAGKPVKFRMRVPVTFPKS